MRLQYAVLLMAILSTASGSALAQPAVSAPDAFQVELFADLKGRPKDPKVFGLAIFDADTGLPPGLYITTGPIPDRSTEIFRVDPARAISVFASGLNTNETLVLARGPYGTGLLVSQPIDMTVRRISPQGTMSVFPSDLNPPVIGTSPFGAAALTYGPGLEPGDDELLYATDFAYRETIEFANGERRDYGRVIRIFPDGRTEPFARIPLPPQGIAETQGLKAMSVAPREFFDGFVVGTLNINEEEPVYADAIYGVSFDGRFVKQIATGFDGLELLSFGPGGAFGNDLYAPTLGTDLNADGFVFRVSPNGTREAFITGIDATHVVFDTENVLGGGMFVGDFNESVGAGRVWRITPR